MIARATDTGNQHGPTAIPCDFVPVHPALYGRYLAIDLTANNASERVRSGRPRGFTPRSGVRYWTSTEWAGPTSPTVTRAARRKADACATEDRGRQRMKGNEMPGETQDYEAQTEREGKIIENWILAVPEEVASGDEEALRKFVTRTINNGDAKLRDDSHGSGAQPKLLTLYPANPRQPTCAERIEEQLHGRLGDLKVAQEIITGAADAEETDFSPAAHELLADHGVENIGEASESEILDAASEFLRSLSLGVSAKTVFRIDLSTGGPGDWLEVECSGDTPRYESVKGDGAQYEIERVSYHFQDWGDHASRYLRDDERELAEAFAREVVPELAE